MSAKLPGKKRKLKQQEKLFEEAEEKKSKKQVIVFEIFKRKDQHSQLSVGPFLRKDNVKICI